MNKADFVFTPQKRLTNYRSHNKIILSPRVTPADTDTGNMDNRIHSMKGEWFMWKIFLLFIMPLLYPAMGIYQLIMNVLGPLGVPDIIDILTTM